MNTRLSLYETFILLLIFSFIWFAPVTEFNVISGDCISYLNSFKVSDNILKRLFTDLPSLSIFRPVADCFIYLCYRVFNTYYYGYYAVSIILHVSCSILIYRISNRLFNLDKVKSLLLTVLFITSMYSYYGIATITGIMEQLCLLFSILFIENLILYIQNKQQKHFILSILYYLIIIFTHERFIVLFSVLFVCVLCDSVSIKQKIYRLVISLSPLLLFVFLKKIVFGGLILKGTGQIPIALDFSQVFTFISRSLKSILGFNNGEPWLFSYFTYQNYNIYMKIASIISLFFILIFILWKTVTLVKEFKSGFISFHKDLSILLILLTALMVSILSYSVSTRIEMRQLYVPFTYFLLILSLIFANYKNLITKFLSSFSFVFVFILFFSQGVSFQSYIKNLFFIHSSDYAKQVLDSVKIYDNTRLFIINHNELLFSISAYSNDNIFSIYYDKHPSVFIWNSRDELEKLLSEKKFTNYDYILFPISYDEIKICNFTNYRNCISNIK